MLFAFFAVGAVFVSYGIWASTFDMEAVKEMPSRSTVFDMDGKIYSRLQGENRIVVPLKSVAPVFVDALLAREDSRFYKHRGVDPIGILRAIARNLIARSSVQGASTITQQLARNSFPERISYHTKNAHRKMLEAFVSSRIEQTYTKEQILEHYMNRIYFGSGVYGIEAASLAYFGKHASELSLSESAMLAGMIRGPGLYSPFTHLQRALGGRDAVLKRMVKLGKISETQAEDAKEAKLNITKKRSLGAQQNYAMDAVQRDLVDLLPEEQRADGGLKIYTSIDPSLQKAAEVAVDSELRKIEGRSGYQHPKRSDFSQEDKDEEAQTPYLQGALVAIDNRNGAIRALVGGRDYSESKLNRAIPSKPQRSVGSTFKPFVYAAAFEKGMLPGMWIDDGALAKGEIRGAANWSPENSDGTFKGTLRAEEGLIQSRNTVSVRVGQFAGLDEVGKVAEASGLPGMPHQPSAFLGAFELNLVQLTSGYTVFPNAGLRRAPYLIERIDDASGEIIYRAPHSQAKAIDPGAAWLVTGALTKVMERGTASTARSMGWTKAAAGKTGTTNDFDDAWFVGYTNSLTCGVWVGLDMPKTIIKKGYGAALALPIWVRTMNAASSQRYPAPAFKSSIPLKRVSVCSVSNGLATAGCNQAGADYSVELPVSMIPRGPCRIHRGSVLADQKPAEEKPEKKSGNGGVFRSFKRFFSGD